MSQRSEGPLSKEIVDLIYEMRWYGKHLSCGGGRADGKSWREAYNTELDALVSAIRSAPSAMVAALDELALDAEHAQGFMLAHGLRDVGMKTMVRRLRALKNALPQVKTVVHDAVALNAHGSEGLTAAAAPSSVEPNIGLSDSEVVALAKRLNNSGRGLIDQEAALHFYRELCAMFKAPSDPALVAVPREPTHLMVTAGRAWYPATDAEHPAEKQRTIVADIYRAMLAAAPAQKGGDRG